MYIGLCVIHQSFITTVQGLPPPIRYGGDNTANILLFGYYLDTTEHLSPFGLSSGSIFVSTSFSDFRCQKFSVRIQLKSFNVAII